LPPGVWKCAWQCVTKEESDGLISWTEIGDLRVSKASGCESRPGSCRYTPVAAGAVDAGNRPAEASGTPGASPGASVQAATRVNPEKAPKVSRWSRPSCHKGKAVERRGSNRPENPSFPAGVVGAACTEGLRGNVRDPQRRRVATANRGGGNVVLGSSWESEGLAVPLKPGNAGGGKEPWFWRASDGGGDRD
jgi:hypothetical protein